ncbi:hypothetical protein QR680_016716 [Steinernema hermaphroditum]|uniref:Uncharacterized protein n=1 Tax=Steinernema hermaphroditum TaxID=289476 RepID=A0AA39HC35_9BILA|nr:hypothetical protein QR680_016716 [Steinernema hermaphroditum]
MAVDAEGGQCPSVTDDRRVMVEDDRNEIRCTSLSMDRERTTVSHAALDHPEYPELSSPESTIVLRSLKERFVDLDNGSLVMPWAWLREPILDRYL